MVNDCAMYQVGLKVLLRKENTVLILRDAQTGHADLPGGRINVSEEHLPLHEIIDREMREELGKEAKYTLGKPLTQFRRSNLEGDILVFITIYDGLYISGDIILSDEHSTYGWEDPKEVVFTEEDWGSKEEYETMNTLLAQM